MASLGMPPINMAIWCRENIGKNLWPSMINDDEASKG